MDNLCVAVDTDAKRDVTIPKSFPESRTRLLVFILLNTLIFAGAAALLINGLFDQWAIGGVVVLAALVILLGVTVAIRIWIFLRLRSQYASSRHDQHEGS